MFTLFEYSGLDVIIQMIEYHTVIVVLDRKSSDAVAADRLAYFLYALAALQLLITAMFACLARRYTYKREYDDDDGSLSDITYQTQPSPDQNIFGAFDSFSSED